MSSFLAALTGWEATAPATAASKTAAAPTTPAPSLRFAPSAALIFWTTTAVKLLCMPFYRSTDFDVHRNWLALTHSLPMRQWYYESTSQWTLDYPPFFALFEWALSFPARFFDPHMLSISGEPYQSGATVVYQRLTVIVSDVLLYYAIVRFVRARVSWEVSFSPPRRQLLLLFLTFANPGLLLLDHVHFQYNGFLLGIFILSLTGIVEGRHLQAAFWFAVLLHFKHIFLYVSPVYFIYLLFAYALRRDAQGRIRTLDVLRLAQLAGIVLGVSALSLGPYIMWGQGAQLLSRLFPFQRGLCHAYWAPNAWVVYNVLDRALVFAARRTGRVVLETGPSTSSGLVEEIAHVYLPTIKSGYTFVLSVVSMSPALWKLSRRPHPRVALSTLNYVSLCSFMLGWHVHEKAILLTLIPLGLSATTSLRDARLYFFLAVTGHYALLPLLFQPTETPLKLLLLATFTLLSALLLADYHRAQQRARRISYGGMLHWAERAYLYGFLPLYPFTQLLLPALLPHMAFLPLLVTSVYCTIGTLHAWRLAYQGVGYAVQQVDDAAEEEAAHAHQQ